MGLAAYVDTNTEKLQGIAGRLYKSNGSKRLAVWAHHANGSYLSAWTAADTLPLLRALGEDLGVPLVVPDCGGPKTWGNDLSQTRLSDARSWANSKFNPKTDKVILIGVSMGGLLALNWARANPALVAAVALLYPAVDLQWVHDNGGAADTEAAYGGAAAFNAAVAAHNPAAHAADFAGMQIAGMQIKMWHSDSDTVVGSAPQVAFANAVGFPRVTLAGAAHADLNAINTQQVRDFLAPFV